MLVGLCQCSGHLHYNKSLSGELHSSPGTYYKSKNQIIMTKKKVKFTTQYTYEFKPEFGESNKGGSQTIQDDHYTVQDLLNKYTQGIMPPVEKRGSYDDPKNENNMEELDITRNPNFDLSDITEFVDSVNHKLEKQRTKNTPSGESVSSPKKQPKKDEVHEDEISDKKGEKHDDGGAT